MKETLAYFSIKCVLVEHLVLLTNQGVSIIQHFYHSELIKRIKIYDIFLN